MFSHLTLTNVYFLSKNVSECLIGFIIWDNVGEQTEMVSASINLDCPKRNIINAT